MDESSLPGSESVQELVFRESGLLSQEEDGKGSEKNLQLAFDLTKQKTLGAVLHCCRICGQIWE